MNLWLHRADTLVVGSHRENPADPRARANIRKIERTAVAVTTVLLTVVLTAELGTAEASQTSWLSATRPVGAHAVAASSEDSSVITRCSILKAVVPRCGDWWGESVPNSGSDLVGAVTNAEMQVERPLDIVHTYHRWLQAFPTPEEATLARGGHILFVNWQPTDPAGNPIAWAAIADGSLDGVIDAEGKRLAMFQMPIMLSFSHEPEAELGTEGTAADFAAAFRRVHDDVIAAGASNVVWVWDVEGISTHHWLSMYHQLWPGVAFVDWIAWDPYNFASCKNRPWRSFRQLVSPFYRWLRAQPFRNRPLMLAELGTVGNLSGSHSKEQWYRDVATSLSAFPAIKSVVYFDYPSPPASCDWTSSASPAAAAAFGRLARNRIFLPGSAASAGLHASATDKETAMNPSKNVPFAPIRSTGGSSTTDHFAVGVSHEVDEAW